ncbi:MAG: methyltransferase domain-containing protein, partial [Chloroflexota bacterium]
FDVVEADHVVEHLEKPFAVMKEIHRILKNNGELVLRVPHFSRGFTHADHKRGFDVTFPLYFNPAFQGGYTGTPFRLTKIRLEWFAQPYLAKTVLPAPLYYIGLSAGAILDFFANISPMLCSRLWCFWVGGFEEIGFRLRAVK